MTRGVVLHQGAIGDFVLTWPMVAAMRATYRVDEVIAIASAASVRLAVKQGVADAWRSPDAVGLHTLFAAEGAVDSRLESILADAAWVVSLLGGRDECVSRRLLKCLKRSAGQRSETSPVLCGCIDPRPRPDTLALRRHISAQWIDDLAPQGIVLPPSTSDPKSRGLQPARCWQGANASLASDCPERQGVLIHPGSGGIEKCWPFERFQSIADRLRDNGWRVSWLLGPAEAERFPKWIEVLTRRANVGESLHVEEDIERAAERIASVSLYIGNDAGMTHVAAALGVATVAIYGPTDPCVWRPLNGDVRIVAPDATGSIERVTVDQVWEMIQSAIRAGGDDA